ncbi:hypothetical protein E7735_16230 [Enterobacter cloacae]|nr:hypothetical protein E7735_16230 [Enterobacter cloacae]QCC97392.1 hypothetical protein E7739_15925 [Enterobacter cloacae]QCD10675.1 hypothetical protein E7729_08690 [Enterobacter cloacae]
MMSLWDALRMNMMISYQELVRTFPNCLSPHENSSNLFSGSIGQLKPHPIQLTLLTFFSIIIYPYRISMIGG